jgi:sugar phosphate permease
MGMLSAANATGQLVFLPMLARVVEGSNWRSAALIVAAAAAAVFVLVLVLMRDRPADVGLAPYGRAADAPPAAPATSMP